MLKTTCKYCRKLNIFRMNIKISGKGKIKTKCSQCGGDIIFRARNPNLEIVSKEEMEDPTKILKEKADEVKASLGVPKKLLGPKND